MALIERNELCKILFEEVKNLNPNSLGDLFIQRGLTLALIHIRMQPEVKQEQEHGHWEYDETIGGMKYYRCTNCEKIEPGSECIIDENQTSWFNFCPKCGAKMKGTKHKIAVIVRMLLGMLMGVLVNEPDYWFLDHLTNVRSIINDGS